MKNYILYKEQPKENYSGDTNIKIGFKTKTYFQKQRYFKTVKESFHQKDIKELKYTCTKKAPKCKK